MKPSRTPIKTRGHKTKQQELALIDTNRLCVWKGFVVGVGLGHKCVHCVFTFRCRKRTRIKKQFGLKHWRPMVDEHNRPTNYEHCLCDCAPLCPRPDFEMLERALLTAGKRFGYSHRCSDIFVPSKKIVDLRRRRPKQGKNVEFQHSNTPEAKNSTVEGTQH